MKKLLEEKGKESIFLERAYELLKKALKSDIKSPKVYNSLAWEFDLRKVYPEETIEVAKRVLDLDPDDPNIMDSLKEAYFAAGDYEKAIYWEKKALEIEPENEFFKRKLKKFERGLKEKKN